MANEVQQNAYTLPPHLMAALQQVQPWTNIAEGIGGNRPPQISIANGRFTRIEADGSETLVRTADGAGVASHLDLIVVGFNPYLSKIYYNSKFSGAGDADAPNCWSDNGIGPSTQAAEPQHLTCAGCPMNAWGSAISDGSGAKIKACRDYKKIAVVLASDPDGTIYQLRVPPASLTGLAEYAKKLAAARPVIPMWAVVTRVLFDTSTSVTYPKLLWAAVAYVSEQQMQSVMEAMQADEIKQVTGTDDVPVASLRAAPPAQPAPAPVQQQPVYQAPVQQPTAPPVVQQPAPTAPPVVQQPAPTAPPVVQQPDYNPAPQAPQPAPQVPGKRHRRTKAEMEAARAAETARSAQPAPQPPVFQAPAQQPAPQPQVAQPAAAPAAPGMATNPELDRLLTGIL